MTSSWSSRPAQLLAWPYAHRTAQVARLASDCRPQDRAGRCQLGLMATCGRSRPDRRDPAPTAQRCPVSGPVSDPADPRRRARRHRHGGTAMTTVLPEARSIPASHLDLLTRAICGVLTTMGGDGQPHSSLVLVDTDGACARVNTTLERQKGRNLLAEPKGSLRVVDPANTGPLHPGPRRSRAGHRRRWGTWMR